MNGCNGKERTDLAPQPENQAEVPLLHALIVDDDASTRTLLRGWMSGLKEFGRPWEAADGQTALEQLRLHDPDLMLLDLVMPGASGFAVLEEMQGLSCRPKVVVISRVGSERLVDQIFSLGADFYFQKPVNLKDLTYVVRLLFYRMEPRPDGRHRGPVYDILYAMGASPKLQGTLWAARLAEALASVPDGQMLLKEAYYAVRRPGDSAYLTVDKNIRDLIQRLHRTAAPDYLRLWDPAHLRPPTCGEFLRLLAREVRRRYEQQTSFPIR